MANITLADKIACIEGMLAGKQLGTTRETLQAVLADLRDRNISPLLDGFKQARRAGAEEMRELAAKTPTRRRANLSAAGQTNSEYVSAYRDGYRDACEHIEADIRALPVE